MAETPGPYGPMEMVKLSFGVVRRNWLGLLAVAGATLLGALLISVALSLLGLIHPVVGLVFSLVQSAASTFFMVVFIDATVAVTALEARHESIGVRELFRVLRAMGFKELAHQTLTYLIFWSLVGLLFLVMVAAFLGLGALYLWALLPQFFAAVKANPQMLGMLDQALEAASWGVNLVFILLVAAFALCYALLALAVLFRQFLLFQVMVIEQRRYFAAIRRSRELIQGRRAKAVGVLFLFFLLYLVVVLPLMGVMVFLLGPLAPIGMVGLFVVALGIMAAMFVMQTLFYYDAQHPRQVA